jgi:hypothetical protein
LYWLFVGARNNGKLLFPVSAHSKAIYAKIMQLGERIAARTDAGYGEMMQRGAAYFMLSQPNRELSEALSYNITEVSNLICSLIARFVLCCEVSESGRRQRITAMYFDAPPGGFGPDHWAATIILVIVLSVVMMVATPGTVPLAAGKILTIAITFGISIGFAVSGAVIVAQRFVERHGGAKPTFPPIAELTISALIVAGLSVILRVGIPLVPALVQNIEGGWGTAIADFVARWPGVILPFCCTISLGLLCSYLGSSDWAWYRLVAIGAFVNGLALSLAGLLVGWLLDEAVLAQFYVHPDQAIRLIMVNTCITGGIVGAMVLVAFNYSQRVRKEVSLREADHPRPENLELFLPPPAADIETSPLAPKSEAATCLGGYTRSSVERLEGRYVCFRPAFSSADVITAYIITVRWDETRSCLVFEEQDRVDAGHIQSGRVYIPDGRPFMSLVTVERGAMRLIMVSRPDEKEPARGLILTLSNPSGVHFTPASAPIVLKRVVDKAPQLGFIRADNTDYEAYRRELEKVVPAFGSFAPSPFSGPTAEQPVKQAENVLLSVVR